MSKDEFVGSEETTHLSRNVEKLFDLLSTKNTHGSGSKSQLCADNMKEWEQCLEDVYDYMVNLKYNKGRLLRAGRRNPAIIGFAAATKSLLNISIGLLTQPQSYKHMP